MEDKYIKEFEFAKLIVKEVYDKVLKNPILNINTKKDKSFVTNIDIECEEFLISRIEKEFPGDSFISEEKNPENKSNSRTWIIDPIDGTACFIKGFLNWGVQLAFVDNSKTQFAIIYMPELNEFYSCYRGKGVFLNDKIVSDLETVDLSHCSIEYVGRLYHDGIINKIGKIYREFGNKVICQLYLYAASSAFSNLISKRTNLLISVCDKIWDIVPGELFCEELGINIIETNYGVKVYSVCKEAEEIIKEII